jgi:Mrp family chromosome partitioning ATPase
MSLEGRIRSVLVPTQVPGLSILPSGPDTSNPAEVLASPATKDLLRCLRGLADVVLVDTAPLNPVADTAALVSQGTGVVLVIEHGKTEAKDALRAEATLARAGVSIIGVVLNKVPKAYTPYYRYKRSSVSSPWWQRPSRTRGDQASVRANGDLVTMVSDGRDGSGAHNEDSSRTA